MTLRMTGFVTFGALCVATFADRVTALQRSQVFRGRVVLASDYWGSMRRNSREETPSIFAARHQKFRETEAALFLDTGFFGKKISLVVHTLMP